MFLKNTVIGYLQEIYFKHKDIKKQNDWDRNTVQTLIFLKVGVVISDKLQNEKKSLETKSIII